MNKLCQQCSNSFEKRSNESIVYFEKKKYCSQACKSSAMKGIDLLKNKRFSGSPWNKGLTYRKIERPTINCLECKQDFVLKANYRKDIVKFCSQKCSQANRDEGKSSENDKIRHSIEYKKWREAIFKRDNYTCTLCTKRGGKLNADHIKPFSVYVELRFELTNGRTLCVECHKKTDTYGGKMIKYKKAIKKNGSKI